MKKVLFLSGLILLSLTTFAQKKKPTKKAVPSKTISVDSTELLNKNQIKNTIQQVEDYVEASLSTKDLSSNQDGLKRYYDSYKITLHAGEEMTIEHSSANFRVMLGLKSPNKQQKTEFSYDSNPFTGNSYNKFHFKAPTTGTYTLLATSMDAGQLGKYSIKKTIYTTSAIESQVDPELTQNFKNLLASKKNNFKDILGEKQKKDKKDKAVDKAAGQERYNAKAEIIKGKPAIIIVDNGGQTANYKSVVFESESEDDTKAYFSTLKKQLQVLTRSWLEQPATDQYFSASTDQDILTINISSVEDKKKKKKLWQLVFTLN